MTPLVAAFVAMLAQEGVAAPLARARVEAVVEACQQHADAVDVRVCTWNAYREVRSLDPDVCDHERDASGRPTCDRRVLRGGRLGPPRAEGLHQVQIGVVLRYGAACGARTLRDARDPRVGACLFAASVASYRTAGCDETCALASHMAGRPGGTARTRRIARARVRAAGRLR